AERGAGERGGAAERGGREDGAGGGRDGAGGGRDGAGQRGGREDGGQRGDRAGDRNQAGDRDGGRNGAERGERGERGGERGERGERGAERGERGGSERGERGGGGRGEARGAVQRLDTRQRTEFRQSITSSSVTRVSNVNFNIAVGTAIPRSITLHTLPPAIISLVPAYRGYRFILVRDDILIIDPDTYEIIDVIPA
ncbi:DUF1236 domain-containing protein, partial [Methylobacterium sp. A54F]